MLEEPQADGAVQVDVEAGAPGLDPFMIPAFLGLVQDLDREGFVGGRFSDLELQGRGLRVGVLEGLLALHEGGDCELSPACRGRSARLSIRSQGLPREPSLWIASLPRRSAVRSTNALPDNVNPNRFGIPVGKRRQREKSGVWSPKSKVELAPAAEVRQLQPVMRSAPQ